MSKPRDLKEQVERASADNFIEWYNRQSGRCLVLLKRGEAPDFVYADEIGKIGLEITTATYDQETYTALGKVARKRLPTPYLSGLMAEPEDALTMSINRALTDKSPKRYGCDCILLVRVVFAVMTTDNEFRNEVIPRIELPAKSDLLEIYITANQRDYHKL